MFEFGTGRCRGRTELPECRQAVRCFGLLLKQLRSGKRDRSAMASRCNLIARSRALLAPFDIACQHAAVPVCLIAKTIAQSSPTPHSQSQSEGYICHKSSSRLQATPAESLPFTARANSAACNTHNRSSGRAAQPLPPYDSVRTGPAPPDTCPLSDFSGPLPTEICRYTYVIAESLCKYSADRSIGGFVAQLSFDSFGNEFDPTNSLEEISTLPR